MLAAPTRRLPAPVRTGSLRRAAAPGRVAGAADGKLVLQGKGAPPRKL